MNSSIVFLTFIFGEFCLADKIKKFKLDVPALIFRDYQYIILGDDVPSRSKTECAAICSATENCMNFHFKATDHLENRCYNISPSHFVGRINTSFDGTPCKLDWTPGPSFNISDNSFPDGSMAAAKNYCRDPEELLGFLYCLKNVTAIGFEYDACNIPKCMNNNCRMYSRDFFDLGISRAFDGISYYTPQN